MAIFPPSLKGTGEGHYAWDRIPDTTLSGVGSTPDPMTNMTVSAVGAATTVNSTMTNGTVSSTAGSGDAKQIVVNLQGRQAVILVSPTAPIVTYQLGERAELKPGAAVLHQRRKPRRHGNRDRRGGRNRRCEAAMRRESLFLLGPTGPAEQEALCERPVASGQKGTSLQRLKQATVRLTPFQSVSCIGLEPPLSSVCS